MIYIKKYKYVFDNAKLKGYAIPQFNINNLEWTKYILEACEQEKSPVVLGVSTGAGKYMGGYNVVRKMVDGLVSDLKISIPVILHLDHGTSVEECKKAIDADFDSIMIDASKYDLQTNIQMTNEVINYSNGQIIEAELGAIGGSEDDVNATIKYTNPIDAQKFIESVDIDLFAPAIGSVHGLYNGEPNIQYDLISLFKSTINCPLVLHGGTGLSDSILEKCIKLGICKININTEFQIAWSNAIKEFIKNNNSVYDPRKIISSGEKAIKEVAANKIAILGSKNKG